MKNSNSPAAIAKSLSAPQRAALCNSLAYPRRATLKSLERRGLVSLTFVPEGFSNPSGGHCATTTALGWQVRVAILKS